MISEFIFLGSCAAMIFFAIIAVPREDDVTLLNVAYGFLATWLAFDNSKLLLTDHIKTFSGGIATSISSDVYSTHLLGLAIVFGASTVYLAWELIRNMWGSGDTNEE